MKRASQTIKPNKQSYAKSISCCLIILSASAILSQTAQAGPLYLGPGTYTIDYAIDGDVWIYDSTVEWLPGASAKNVTLSGTELTMFGGAMDFMYLPEFNSNSVSIYDGSVGRILNADGWRYVNLFGGTIGQVSLAVEGGLIMRGGTVGGIDGLQAHAYIHDGLIDGNVEACQLVFHMSGGILRGDLIAQCWGFYPIDGFYIYGHGFEINGLPVGSGTYILLPAKKSCFLNSQGRSVR